MLGNNRAQNAVEYILLFVIIIFVLIAILAPNGFYTQAVDDAFNSAVSGIEGILDNTW